MKPAFFGRAACKLFGIHEPPRAAATKSSAVLLCYPGVQEYNMAHWAFRRLSSSLTREGLHVLRFDWSGTGDSWGSTAEGTLEQWLGDVDAAVQELRDASGMESVSVVGLRLGGAIAALASARGIAFDQLVLWEPVIRGDRYIAELERLDAKENRRLLHLFGTRRTELVGFPFPDNLRSSLGRVDLRESRPQAKRVAIFAATDTREFRDLARTFEGAGMDARFHHTPEEAGTTNAGELETAFLANRSLTAIADHLLGKPAP
jgi:pimeloyl-ACP methyl ester carboxylesterase